MNKNVKVILMIISIVFLTITFFYFFGILGSKGQQDQKTDLFSMTDQEIIETLKTNKDVAEYVQTYGDFTIESKEVLTKESILSGQNGQSFQEVYNGLELENNRYTKIKLINSDRSIGFIAVIDSKDNSVPKAFGIILFKASANQSNGEKTSETTD